MGWNQHGRHDYRKYMKIYKIKKAQELCLFLISYF